MIEKKIRHVERLMEGKSRVLKYINRIKNLESLIEGIFCGKILLRKDGLGDKVILKKWNFLCIKCYL